MAAEKMLNPTTQPGALPSRTIIPLQTKHLTKNWLRLFVFKFPNGSSPRESPIH
jgi:hypothetical protein